MFSKDEAFQIRKKFWTLFGQYMKLQNSASGVDVNWVNYKTGIKDLYFKTDVDNKSARIAIEIAQKDLDIQELMFAQFEEFRNLFENSVGIWVWHSSYFDKNGKQLGLIELSLENVSIFNETTWPDIFNFLKENLLKLDEFWENVKITFEMLK